MAMAPTLASSPARTPHSCTCVGQAGPARPCPARIPAGASHHLSFSQGCRWSRRETGNLQVAFVGWDPEGILSAPQAGHIGRRQYQKHLEKDEVEKEEFERQVQMERERRRAAREARLAPETLAGLVDYLLDTEAQDMEFEIARCRPRLTTDLFAHLKHEMSSLRFAASPSQQTGGRLMELEALEKVLLEGTEAYDKMASNVINARHRLAKILESKDKRATLLEMAGENELDRPLLALLDENIAAANSAGQEQAAVFMERIRGAVVKYMSV